MDFVLFGFVGIGFLVGTKKSKLGLIFAFFLTIISFYLAYKFCGEAAQTLGRIEFFENNIKDFIEKKLCVYVDDKTSVSDLFAYFENQKLGFIVVFVLKKLFTNIEFQNGQELRVFLTDKLAETTIKVLAFVVIFVVCCVLIKLLMKLVKKFVKNTYFGSFGVLIGGVFGAIYALMIFLFLYNVISFIGNVTFNQQILEFVDSGQISKLICGPLYQKTISLIL